MKLRNIDFDSCIVIFRVCLRSAYFAETENFFLLKVL